MMQKLKTRTMDYDNWVAKVNLGIQAKSPELMMGTFLFSYSVSRRNFNVLTDLEDLKALLLEGETKGFPRTPSVDCASRIVESAENCVKLALKLTHATMKTR